MFPRLLVPLCLAAFARADHYEEDLPALEPQSLEAEVRFPSFDAEIPEFFNTTLEDQPSSREGSKVGAHVERVLLTMCSGKSAYLPHFYEGLVVNSRAWKTTGNERFTSVALSDGNARVSSASGAWPVRKKYIFHSWDMVTLKNPAQDIRKHNPGTIYYWTWNAMQQIYIPLYLANEQYGIAYMLHIYPEADFLLNPPADTTYTDALVWAKGDRNRMYMLDIDVEGMIRSLRNFQVPDYKKYITPRGVAYTDDRTLQEQVTFLDYRKVTVDGANISTSREGLCGYSMTGIDIGWPDMRFILDREFSWL